MQSIVKILSLSLSVMMCHNVHARDAMDRPNVIIIYLDDSGYGDYSHNGNPVIETPNISKLAAAGTSFTQFYVSSPACSASRYSLLTGRYPGHSQLGSWVIGPSAKKHLRTEETTIAEGLKAKGYATGMFGKWHLGSPNKANNMSPDTLPLAHGFDRWIGTNVSHDYGNAKLLKSDTNGSNPIQGYSEVAKDLPSDVKASESLTGRYSSGVVEFIKENKDKPFFAYVAHNQPHLGLFASDAFKGKSRRGLLGDVMAEVDDSVGKILDTLKEQGIEKNTIVFFSSDNGPWVMFRDKAKTKYGEARMHVGYAMPFRDGKGSCWEGGHRVPSVFYWPGVIDAKRELTPASTLDVLPTLFALTGAELPKAHKPDGRDIRSLLAPQKFKGEIGEFEFYYSHARNNLIAIRKGPWKLMVAIPSQTGNKYGFEASEKKPLLFNVEQDISERIDRAAEKPELVQELLEELLKKRQEMR
ncbi:N-acetylgalactosamine-6-sulfatase [Oceaniferula spumae]|uniref:N-acetylgalactosamine-6-sulfatase n=1 Tax=Oceaniferula spumae TaxID=2979115 RepID=A0AAT9FLI3_9BACT